MERVEGVFFTFSPTNKTSWKSLFPRKSYTWKQLFSDKHKSKARLKCLMLSTNVHSCSYQSCKHSRDQRSFFREQLGLQSCQVQDKRLSLLTSSIQYRCTENGTRGWTVQRSCGCKSGGIDLFSVAVRKAEY